MNIRNLVVGFVMLGAASAASAGIYECEFNVDNTLFTCANYDPNAGLPTTPVPPTSPPVNTNVDPGHGLWVPSGMGTRTVADISGPAGYVVSYIPGCLNGSIANNSFSGCASNNSYTGTIVGTTTNRMVKFGDNSELLLRYWPRPAAGTSLKLIRLRSASGNSSDLGVKDVRMWLSTDPYSTYETTDTKCKMTSSSSPYIVTGPGYCPITENVPIYYLGISYSSPEAVRFQVDQSGSDFQ